jgi:NhaC family Na+:H+ antiporter
MTDDQPIAPSSLAAALLTVGGMVLMILASVVLFGEGAEDGPLQVAMTLGLTLALAVAMASGNSAEELSGVMRKSIDSALGTVFVLLAVGALIGSLFLSGTIATVIYYGAQFGTPQILYILVFVVASGLSYAIGSSFTTIAAVGLPFVALAPAMGVSPVVTAAAAVCGAFTGDSLGRISDTFILTASVVGAKTKDHARALRTVVAPGWLVSAGFFVILGLRDGNIEGYDSGPILEAIEGQFSISPVAFLPLVVVLVLSAKTTAFLSLMTGTVTAILLAALTQGDLISSMMAGEGLGAIGQWATVSLSSLGNGFQLSSGVEELDSTFVGGGVVSMLTTVWLILVAAAFGALVDSTGMLRRLLAPLLAWAKGAVRIIVASAITGIGLNAATADPYMSIILSSATYRERFIEARLEPYVESASIAGSGSIFSPLIPWNVHGAFVAGTLGIGVLAYAPYAVLLWLTPVVLIGIGIARFSHDSISGTGPAEEAYGPEPQELPERRASV